MRGSMIWAVPLFAVLCGASGCSNTVRYMTARQWLTVDAAAAEPAPSGAAAVQAPGGAPAAAQAPGGAPAAVQAPGGAPAAAQAPDTGRVLYITYWEGTCSSGFLGFGKGCSLGDSKIRRCNLKPDNLLVCVDEAKANQFFARQKK